MLAGARFDLLVMSDSDTRVGPGLLRVIAAEFQDERLGLATCPYRAVPGSGIWSTLEAIGMNTEFLAGILVARLLEGMRFGVGPTMAIRREAIGRMGGFAAFKDYLAEDFEMGRRAADLGYGTILSSSVIEHRIGTARMRPNFEHRLRWVRSTRRSRPAGYIGQLFTYPLPLALLLWAVRPGWWPAAALAIAIRAAAAWATAGWVLSDRLTLNAMVARAARRYPQFRLLDRRVLREYRDLARSSLCCESQRNLRPRVGRTPASAAGPRPPGRDRGILRGQGAVRGTAPHLDFPKFRKPRILPFSLMDVILKTTISRHRLISIPGDEAQLVASPSE